MIDPQDIDPDTGRQYPGYSDDAIDTSFHDHEMDVDDDDDGPRCIDANEGHSWVFRDDDPEVAYCELCGCGEY